MQQILFKNLNQDQKKIRIKNKILRIILSGLYEGRELTPNAFRSGVFPIKEKKGRGLKLLTPKQIFQRLPVALCNCYRAKKITKKVYNNIMNSIKL